MHDRIPSSYAQKHTQLYCELGVLGLLSISNQQTNPINFLQFSKSFLFLLSLELMARVGTKIQFEEEKEQVEWHCGEVVS